MSRVVETVGEEIFFNAYIALRQNIPPSGIGWTPHPTYGIYIPAEAQEAIIFPVLEREERSFESDETSDIPVTTFVDYATFRNSSFEPAQRNVASTHPCGNEVEEHEAGVNDERRHGIAEEDE
jgi:hypothetical protein